MVMIDCLLHELRQYTLISPDRLTHDSRQAAEPGSLGRVTGLAEPGMQLRMRLSQHLPDALELFTAGPGGDVIDVDLQAFNHAEEVGRGRTGEQFLSRDDNIHRRRVSGNAKARRRDTGRAAGRQPAGSVHFHGFAKSHIASAGGILGTTLGEENTYGALSGRTPSGPVTFARVSTGGLKGSIRAYVGEGRFTDDPLATFGSRAVVEVPDLPKLMRHICRNGFEHHAAMNASSCAKRLADALETYLSWPVYHHQ
jgi:hypothetical protein